MHVGNTVIRRRTVLKGAALGTALAFSPATYRAALAAPTVRGPGPYGPLQGPDGNGVMLPAGFASRIIAIGNREVAETGYTWPVAPDGSACFPKDDGGYYYVCNSEVFAPPGQAGASGIEIAPDGTILGAYSILSGTTANCAGGPTPWGTWLSCEEAQDGGQVWECQPDGSADGVALPALGFLSHEAVAVDPDAETLYLTEDQPNGLFYRFLPADYPDLTVGGQLQAAILDEDGHVTWMDVDPAPGIRMRAIPIGATEFNGGEGIWFDQVGPGEPGYVYFTTKGDDVVWVHDITANTITKLYDAADFDEPVLTGVDNVTVAPSGDVLIAEDGGDLEIVLISADTREAAPLVRLPGGEHTGSEITGPSFSPDGTRLYFSSQRAVTDSDAGGITYEVSGPFRLERIGLAAVGVASTDGSATADGDANEGAATMGTNGSATGGSATGGSANGAADEGPQGAELATTGGGSVLTGIAAIGAAALLRGRGVDAKGAATAGSRDHEPAGDDR